jgi:uncharacterized membrane-anchored protein
MNTTRNISDKDLSNAGKKLLSKVPEITIYFWIIKILCTTVGETFADFLGTTLNLGEVYTGLVMAALLAVILYFQFKAKKYVPGIYWLAIVLISVVGTLITDNLSDNLGVPLYVSTIVFAILLIITFAVWYKKEKTLSIHSIFTRTRESFYWLAILFTFALGTAAGDLIGEQFNLGYPLSIVLFGGLIALTFLAYKKFKLNPVLAFWIGYILTRPLGASIGDYLSQAPGDGGLGLGTTITSGIFLVAILGTVIYLAVTKKDVVGEKELVS